MRPVILGLRARRQDAFNKVWDHFVVKGNPRAVKPGTSTCVYRLDNDPKSPVRCAMGVLIPDEMYDPSWEDTQAIYISALDDIIQPLGLDFVGRLQMMHDRSDSAPMRERLVGFASLVGLEIPDGTPQS